MKALCKNPAAGDKTSLDPTSAELKRAHAEIESLKAALNASGRFTSRVQQQVHALTDANLRLQRKLVRLSKQASEALHLAYHDALTGLPNRALLFNRLKQARCQSAREGKQVALLFLDLDGFKFINDRFGHAAGDQLLKQVADRIAASIRGGDTACRYGGDEFVVMLPAVTEEEAVLATANKLHELLIAPYAIDGRLVTINVSIGLATCTKTAGANEEDDLIRQADAAMYRMKSNGHRQSRRQVMSSLFEDSGSGEGFARANSSPSPWLEDRARRLGH